MDTEELQTFYDALFTENFDHIKANLSKSSSSSNSSLFDNTSSGIESSSSINDQKRIKLARNKKKVNYKDCEMLDYLMSNGKDRDVDPFCCKSSSSTGSGSNSAVFSDNSLSDDQRDQHDQLNQDAFNDSLSDLNEVEKSRFNHFNKNYTMKTLLILRETWLQDRESFNCKMIRAMEVNENLKDERMVLMEKLSELAGRRELEHMIPDILRVQKDFCLE